MARARSSRRRCGRARTPRWLLPSRGPSTTRTTRSSTSPSAAQRLSALAISRSASPAMTWGFGYQTRASWNVLARPRTLRWKERPEPQRSPRSQRSRRPFRGRLNTANRQRQWARTTAAIPQAATKPYANRRTIAWFSRVADALTDTNQDPMLDGYLLLVDRRLLGTGTKRASSVRLIRA